MDIERRSGCPINLTVAVLGDRWSLVVIRDIVFGKPAKKTKHDCGPLSDHLANTLRGHKTRGKSRATLAMKRQFEYNANEAVAVTEVVTLEYRMGWFAAAFFGLPRMPTTGANRNRSREMVQILSRMAFGLLLVMAPISASAQVGRVFVSAEAYAGMSRVLYVGKIVELQRIDYNKPLTSTQSIGKPYRLVFEVNETIRGEKLKRLELVLSLQNTIYLDYMRGHALEIMLVGGPTCLDSFPQAEVGIEEHEKRVDGDWYQFRVLDPLQVPKSGVEKAIASQINTYYDSGRMFTAELEVVAGSKEILKHVRDFAKKHPQTLSAVTLRVPNEFGALCGSPNAYCVITLPICPETKATLDALKADPGPILRRIKPRVEEYYNRLAAEAMQANRAGLVADADKALAEFSSDGRK
jgi:hypothetical protein